MKKNILFYTFILLLFNTKSQSFSTYCTNTSFSFHCPRNDRVQIELLNPNTGNYDQVIWQNFTYRTTPNHTHSYYSSYARKGIIYLRASQYDLNIFGNWSKQFTNYYKFVVNTTNILIDDFCNNEGYFYDYNGGMIDNPFIPFSTMDIKFVWGVGLSKAITSQYEVMNLTQGSYDLTINHMYEGCSIDIIKRVEVRNKPNLSWSGSGLSDTLIANSSPVNLSALVSTSGTALYSSNNGAYLTGSTLYYSPSFADTGVNVVKVTASNGYCDTTITDSVYIKYNPGLPFPPEYFCSSKNDSIYVVYNANSSSPIIFKNRLTTNFKDQRKSFVCDGNNYSFTVLNPNIGNTNPLDDYTYQWDLFSNSTLIQTVTGVTGTVTIPNNGLNDSLILICRAKNSLGVYGNGTNYNLVSTSKPNFNIVDTVCYNKNGIVPTIRYNPFYFVYPSKMDSMKMDSSLARTYLINGTVYTGDTIVNTFSGSKLSQAVVTSKIISDFLPSDTIIDSSYFGSTLIITKGVVLNQCECGYDDTIIFVRNPIISIVYVGDTLVSDGYRVQITNTSQFYDSSVWTTTMDRQIYNTTHFDQFVHNHGYHDFNLSLFDRYGCRTDTTIIDLLFCRNPADSANQTSIKENEIISNFKVFPNPSTFDFNIQFYSSVEDEITIYILDLSGRIIHLQNHKIKIGHNDLITLGENIAKGSYIMTFQGKKVKGYQKIYKL